MTTINSRSSSETCNEDQFATLRSSVITDMKSDSGKMIDVFNTFIIVGLAVHDVLAAVVTLSAYLIVIAIGKTIQLLMGSHD